MSLRMNLDWAAMAVAYAHDSLRGRSSNRPEDLIHTMQDNLQRRYGHLAYGPDLISDTLSNPHEIQRLTHEIYPERWGAISDAREARTGQGTRLNAAAILADGVGNCFEHAVLACHFLNGKGVASYMADTDDNTNHCFVLIGAPGGLDGQSLNVTQANPGALNGGMTVVCDPWYHEWFGVQQDWGRKMWRIFTLTTKFPPMPSPVPLTLTSSVHVT